MGVFEFVPNAVWITLVALIVCLPLLFRIKGQKGWIRYFKTRLAIRDFLERRRKERLKSFPDLRQKNLTPEEFGLIPSAKEQELESPCTESSPEHCDGVHFAGVSPDGHVFDICIDRISDGLALVWVVLKLPDGTAYSLPPSDTRRPYIASEGSFSSSGLQIKCLSPLRRWRISFNGLLRRIDNTTGADSDGLVHTKFSFVWLAMSAPQDQNLSYSDKELAAAFIEGNRDVGEKDLLCLQELQNRYEQWGQMMGTVAIGGGDQEELYLWTIRTRVLDSPLWEEEMSSVKLYMYFMDGVNLKVETISIQNFVSNLTSGYTIAPSGAVSYISECDLKTSLAEGREAETEISFVLNKDRKKVHIKFDQLKATLYTGPELQHRLSLKPFEARVEGFDKGYGILHHSLRNTRLQGPTPDREKVFQTPPLLLKDPGYSSVLQKSVSLLEDELCCSSNVSGGKGSSLALLTKLSRETHQFVVPKGFVITTKAFEDHICANKAVSEAIQKLNDVSCRRVAGDLKKECEKCTKTFASSDISEYLKSEIRRTLSDIYKSLQDIRFSVRSSAFGEDSEDLSAAGQMLTILGIRGVEKVFQAVVECWSSKFSFEAVQYARQNGQSLLSPMAVVVQEMVPSEISGVLFTVDPVTGDPSRPHLTANFGLGETVVSALADPDTVILRRNQDQSVEVFHSSVGSKKTQVFMKAGHGVERMDYENHSLSSCLTDEWAVKIGNAGILVESCFCSPRDIEWAVHDGQLFLLQARPITTLHTETEFELIHDQDTPTRSTDEYWTRANTGEVFLGATSPLGISVVVNGMDLYNHKHHVVTEGRQCDYTPYYFHILPSTHRQICINLVDMLFRANEKEVTLFQKAFEAALFGRAVINDEMHSIGVKKYGYVTKLKKYRGLLLIPLFALRVPKAIVQLSEMVSKYRLPLEEYTTARRTWDGIMKQLSLFNDMFGVHGMATFLSSYGNMMLMTILAKGKKEWDAELYCDFATMLSSVSEVESAGVPESLQELSKAIAKNFQGNFQSLTVEAAFNWLRNDSGESGKLFKKFLQQHGHRCVKEFDLQSKSWGMQPESLMPTLQTMVSATNVQSKTASKEVLTTEDIISRIKTPLSSFNKKVLNWLLPRSRKYVCHREKTKSMLIKTVDWLRISFNHLGQMMVNEGMLPESELVFFLTLEEVKEIMESQKPGLVHKAVRRMRLHPRLNELKLPEIMYGIPRPVQVQTDLSSYAASFTLKGTPVCQGRVKARAAVVLTLDQASEIKSGDILITYSTDIGWSPYFPLLSGVVTVLGGLISHGAVIARECGLPCVVGVENATIAFKSGDMVLLNGTKGTVTKILETEVE